MLNGHDSPQALCERIRRNKAIIKDREFETCIRNGKFKTDKMVGFDFCMFENQQCEINSYKIKTNSNQTL